MRFRRVSLFVILTIVVGGIFLLYFVAGLRLAFYRDPWPSAVVSRTELELPTTFTPVTRLSDVFIEADAESEMFFLVDDFLHIVGAFDPQDPPGLTRVRLSTKQVAWKENVPLGVAVAHNSTHVYVGAVGVARVVARELESGAVDWRTTLFPRKSVAAMTADDTTVFAETVPVGFYLLDAETGEVVDEPEDYMGLPVHFGQDDIVYIGLARGVLAQSLETDSIVWRVDLDDEVTWVQASGEDSLLLRSGREIGSLYAIDVGTGDNLWQTDKTVLSNVAVAGNVAFFLTDEAELQAGDVVTGRLVAMIQFEPSDVVLQTNGHKRAFLVAGDDSAVAVYFGDAREVFSYRFAFNEP